jgi:hypothetical protein
MSKVQLAGNASGTGIFQIASPNSNTDRTLTLPDASGTVQLSGNPISGTTGTFTGLLDISASGAGQIKFPATQNASTDANTLDDYEEGTWTPTDGSGAGLSFTSAYGYYIKVGKVVYVQAKIIYPSTASASNNQVNGLPFSMSNTNPYNYPIGPSSANGNTNALRAYGFGSSFAFLTTGDQTATNANLSNGNINFNMTYIATS